MVHPCDLICESLDCLLSQQPLPDLSSLRDTDAYDPILIRLLHLHQTFAEQAAAIGRLETQLKDYAFIDSLTGVANRRAGLQVLQEQIEACAGNTPLALCFIDLDDLKHVNDRFGHGEGDRFIRLVSRALLQKVRSNDTVARVGGDEFIVIMPGASAASAEQRMRAIMENLADNPAIASLQAGPSEPVAPAGACGAGSMDDSRKDAGIGETCDYRMTFSFGVAAVLPHEHRTAAELLGAADQAMYACKRKKQQLDSAQPISPAGADPAAGPAAGAADDQYLDRKPDWMLNRSLNPS